MPFPVWNEEGQLWGVGRRTGEPDEGSSLWAGSWYADRDSRGLSGPESPFPKRVAPLPLAGPTPSSE